MIFDSILASIESRKIDIGHHLNIEDHQVAKLSKEVSEKPRRIKLGPRERTEVVIGFPLQRGMGVGSWKEGEIPNRPHVFVVHELWINDKTHKDTLLVDVPVILAHGGRGTDGTWVFGDDQSITQTVSDYENWARLNDYPPLLMVLACNEDKQVVNLDEQCDVRFLDFGPSNIGHPIIQAVGYSIEILQTRMGKRVSGVDNNGKVIFCLSTDGRFQDVEAVVEYQELLKQIKVG